MGSGSHFGEISFVDEGFKRSATAEVLEHSEIIRFDYSRLRTLFQENPELGAVFYRGVAQFLAKRLRNTTHDFSANRDRLKQVA
jgi:CRP-like cAMP-binding protein